MAIPTDGYTPRSVKVRRWVASGGDVQASVNVTVNFNEDGNGALATDQFISDLEDALDAALAVNNPSPPHTQGGAPVFYGDK